MNEQEKLMYSFDMNQFEQDNVYATLPGPRVTNNHRQNGHSLHRLSSHSQQRLNHNQADQFEVHHYEPKGPGQEYHQQQARLLPPSDIELVTIFTELAQSVGIQMPNELTRHILTLIRLGVPPDEIYIFLRECIDSKRNES